MTDIALIDGSRFDPAKGDLWTAEGARRLEDRTARTLALLCRHRGEVVSKATILEHVWQGRAVSANSVAIVIADLRRALGEDARAPRLIETVGKRGYRLTAPVATIAVPTPVRRSARGGWWRWVILAAFLVVAILGAAITIGVSSSRQTVLVIEAVRNETGERRYDPLARALTALIEDRVAKMRSVRVAEAGARSGSVRSGRRLEVRARLTIWNDTPTLSIAVVRPADDAVVWTAMVVAPADRIAAGTISRLAEAQRFLASRSR